MQLPACSNVSLFYFAVGTGKSYNTKRQHHNCICTLEQWSLYCKYNKLSEEPDIDDLPFHTNSLQTVYCMHVQCALTHYNYSFVNKKASL